jgi:hypothetical protein
MEDNKQERIESNLGLAANAKLKITFKNGRKRMLTIQEALSPRFRKQLTESTLKLLTTGTTITTELAKMRESEKGGAVVVIDNEVTDVDELDEEEID